MEKEREVKKMGQYMKEGDSVIPGTIITVENIRKGRKPVNLYIHEVTTRPSVKKEGSEEPVVVAAIIQRGALPQRVTLEREVVSRGGEEFTFGFKFRAFGAAVRGVVDFARDMVVPLGADPENGIPTRQVVGIPSLSRYLAPITVQGGEGPVRR